MATLCKEKKRSYDGWLFVMVGFTYKIIHFAGFNGCRLPLYVVDENGFVFLCERFFYIIGNEEQLLALELLYHIQFEIGVA